VHVEQIVRNEDLTNIIRQYLALFTQYMLRGLGGRDGGMREPVIE
jgi:hypothetical protein